MLSEESSLAGDVFVVAMFRRPAAGDPGGPPGLRPSLPGLASGPTGQGSGHQRASTAGASSESQVATCPLASWLQMEGSQDPFLQFNDLLEWLRKASDLH